MPGSWTRAGRRPRVAQEEMGLRGAAGALRGRPGLGAAQRPDPRPVGPRDRRADWPRSASGPPSGRPRRARPLRVEYKQVGGRHFGANSIPARAWLDSYDDAWALLRVGAEVAPPNRADRGGPRHPAGPVADRDTLCGRCGSRATGTGCWPPSGWIEQRQAPGMYLRQVDVPGVDTKFIERHKGVLTELLDAQLDPSRVIDAARPTSRGGTGSSASPATSGSGWPAVSAGSPSCPSAQTSSPRRPRALPGPT